jgi:glycosyltransferase involved in cell wall biosynthesis
VYDPKWFLSCGRTHRDDKTMSAAAEKSGAPIRVIWHQTDRDVTWPSNVELMEGGAGWENRLSYQQLIKDHYAGAIASLIIVDRDPIQYTACGFTGLIEAMGLGRPVILTRTSAVESEIDVEKAGCGIHVVPNDVNSLADAITTLANDHERARAMGVAARKLAEDHYNIERFARDLHVFFESL